MTGQEHQAPTRNRHDNPAELPRVRRAVSRFALGTAALAGMFQHVEAAEADETIRTALEHGVTYFDTAPQYGAGLAERRLGHALAGIPRDAYCLSTKVGRLIEPAYSPVDSPWVDADRELTDVFDFSSAGIRRSLQESLERLGVTRVDVAYIHDPESQLDRALDESIDALLTLREQGLVDAIGVGTNVAATALRFVNEAPIDVALVAGRYTLLDDDALELLDAAQERGIGVVAAGVFNSGILASPDAHSTFDYQPASPQRIAQARRLAELAEEAAVPLAAAALQFPLRHPAVDCVLVGCRSPRELLSDLNEFDLEIPAELWDRLLDQRAHNLLAEADTESEGKP